MRTTNVDKLVGGDFPPAVRPFWENVKDDKSMRLALTLTAIVCYCSLSPRLRVKYVYDLAQSMLLLNLLVIGPSGSGKSMIRWCVNMLMRSQLLRDQDERRKLREYKEAARLRVATRTRARSLWWPYASCRSLPCPWW